MTDIINRPAHYTAQPVESIELVQYMPFMVGNAFKYVWRYRLKNGLEDLQKARYYINRQLDCFEGDTPREWELPFPLTRSKMLFFADNIPKINRCDFNCDEKECLKALTHYCDFGNTEHLRDAQQALDRIIKAWKERYKFCDFDSEILNHDVWRFRVSAWGNDYLAIQASTWADEEEYKHDEEVPYVEFIVDTNLNVEVYDDLYDVNIQQAQKVLNDLLDKNFSTEGEIK